MTCLFVLQWTPLGFTLRDPNSLDNISRERFEGTVLRAISKRPRKDIKEPEEPQRGGVAPDGQVLLRQMEKPNRKVNGINKNNFSTTYLQVKIKEEKTDDEAEAKPEERAARSVNVKEEEVMVKKEFVGAVGAEMGRLVMTIDGQQKQLSFSPKDLLSTATMLDGDKVRGGSSLAVRRRN